MTAFQIAAERAEAESQPQGTSLFRNWLVTLTALGTFWLLLFHELSGEWRVNPQYSYGYVVPLLAVILFWRRWLLRPVPSPPQEAAFVAAVSFLLIFLF